MFFLKTNLAAWAQALPANVAPALQSVHAAVVPTLKVVAVHSVPFVIVGTATYNIFKAHKSWENANLQITASKELSISFQTASNSLKKSIDDLSTDVKTLHDGVKYKTMSAAQIMLQIDAVQHEMRKVSRKLIYIDKEISKLEARHGGVDIETGVASAGSFTA